MVRRVAEQLVNAPAFLGERPVQLTSTVGVKI